LPEAYGDLGDVLKNRGQHQEAEAAYRQAITISRKLAADFPSVAAYRNWLAGSSNGLSLLLQDRGRYEEAEAVHRQALVVCEKLVADFPADPWHRQTLAWTHHCL